MRYGSLAKRLFRQSYDVWQAANAILNKSNLLQLFTNLLYQFSVLFVIIYMQVSCRLQKFNGNFLNGFSEEDKELILYLIWRYNTQSKTGMSKGKRGIRLPRRTAVCKNLTLVTSTVR